MDKGRLTIIPPRTAAEIEACIRRRHRFRLTICRWAVRRAKEDPGFDAEQEAVGMIRMLGLTLAEDEKIRARTPIGASATKGWTRGATK